MSTPTEILATLRAGGWEPDPDRATLPEIAEYAAECRDRAEAAPTATEEARWRNEMIEVFHAARVPEWVWGPLDDWSAPPTAPSLAFREGRWWTLDDPACPPREGLTAAQAAEMGW